MPDNYEHYISKNIQAFYRRRLFSPMIYLVLLAVLWIVFPLGAMLRPAQLSDNTKIADAYKNHHRYVRMTFTDLKFSGYTCETYGQTRGYYYYTTQKNNCSIILLTPHTCEEGLPTIISVTDVSTGTQNGKLTPGGGLVGTGNRIKIAGEEGKAVGFFFVNAKDETETAVPMTSLIRNDPSAFSLIIPALADGSYYLEVATQYGGNNKFFLKEIRRNRFPYPLSVGTGNPDSESPDEI